LATILSILPIHAWATTSDAAGLATAAYFLLPPKAAPQDFTFSFPVPEEEWENGVAWVRRKIRVSDSLAIVDENLARQWYRVTVRLVGKDDQPARGSLYVFLKKGSATSAIPPRPDAPTNLRPTGQPLKPDFLFDGTGETSAFTLYRYPGGEEIWSRAFSEGGWGRLDEGSLEINGRYLLKAQQSNSAARYSAPAYVWFRVVASKKKCQLCQGTGQYPKPQENNKPSKPCELCAGTGIILTPRLEVDPPKNPRDDALEDSLVDGVD
jgi:hypothetical protein